MNTAVRLRRQEVAITPLTERMAHETSASFALAAANR